MKRKLGGLARKAAPERIQEQVLEQVIVALQQYPETKFLLDMAARDGIGRAFDPELDKMGVGAMLVSDRSTGQQYIALSPTADPMTLAHNLIHELRHMWQNKVLGLTPQTAGRAEPDAETALLLTRVREADAYAFSNLMLKRIYAHKEDAAEERELVDKFEKANGKPVDEFQKQMITRYMGEKFTSRMEDEHREMVLDFVWALQNIDSYDRRALVAYHNRYTSPHQPSEPHAQQPGKPFDVADIRRMLRLGVSDNMPAYLEGVPDGQFRDAALQDVAPALKQVTSLMDAFEKAARKGLAPQQDMEQRAKIEQSLAAAVNAPPVPIIPSRHAQGQNQP